MSTTRVEAAVAAGAAARVRVTARGRGGDDDSTLDLGWHLLTAHVALGSLIVLLAVLRVVSHGPPPSRPGRSR